jgi:hypothetical protein
MRVRLRRRCAGVRRTPRADDYGDDGCVVGRWIGDPPVALVFTVLPAAVATVLAVTYLLAIPGSGPPATDERTQPT